MTCRTATDTRQPMTAVEALDKLDNLLGHVLRRNEAGASSREISARLAEAQVIAITGAAFGRRSERDGALNEEPRS